MVNLRADLVFGNYSKDSLNHSISTFHLPLTFLLKEASKPELVNKEFIVANISHSHITLQVNKDFFSPKYILAFNQISGDLLFNKEQIEVTDLLKELQLKNAKQEFSDLFYAKLKNGRYVGDYFQSKSSLIYFFNQNEENFLILDSCLNNKNFYFPKDPDDKQKLVDFITSTSPHLIPILDELFFTHPEKNNTNNTKIKP